MYFATFHRKKRQNATFGARFNNRSISPHKARIAPVSSDSPPWLKSAAARIPAIKLGKWRSINAI